MKRLVFCFDGTWNKLSANCPTNVVLLAEMVKPITSDGTAQIVYYDEGVGTARSERIRGGAFGRGMMTNIREAYRFLIFNYEPGDHIFAFGFSRGAFTARSFVSFIRHAGILNVSSAKEIEKAIELYKAVEAGGADDTPEALKFRADHCSQICVSDLDKHWRIGNRSERQWEDTQVLQIKYVGVWDTVAALGVPEFVPFATRINRKFKFHDAKLTSKVQAARHAVAIDERRVLFEPVVWDNVGKLNAQFGKSIYAPDAPYQQKWFPGVHGSVGGGGSVRGLSDAALHWVLKGAKQQGLEIRNNPEARAFDIAPDHRAALRNDPDLPWHDRGIIGAAKRAMLSTDRVGPSDVATVSSIARRRWNTPADELPEKKLYRPPTLKEVADKMLSLLSEPHKPDDGWIIHIVVAGDTLSKLAAHYLGDAERWSEIFEANRDQLDDPDDLFVGMKLRMPKIPPSSHPN